jgi:hypothetical protein
MRMNARLMFSASPKPTVIARHNWTSESELDGKATTTKIKVMQVWLKDGGAWKLLARQAARPHPAGYVSRFRSGGPPPMKRAFAVEV